MISFDPRQLELVSQFAGLLQFLSDTKDLKTVLDQAAAFNAEIKERQGLLETKEKVDAYITAELDKLDAEKARREKLMETDKQDLVDQKAQVQADQAEVAKAKRDVSALKKAVQDKLDDLKAREEEVNATLERAKNQAADVEQRKQDVLAKEVLLDEKLATVRKMLGQE